MKLDLETVKSYDDNWWLSFLRERSIFDVDNIKRHKDWLIKTVEEQQKEIEQLNKENTELKKKIAIYNLPQRKRGQYHHSCLLIVNGRNMVFNKALLSYDEALDLAGFKQGIYTVTFSAGTTKGSLLSGQSIPVLDGMVINVSQADNA